MKPITVPIALRALALRKRRRHKRGKHRQVTMPNATDRWADSVLVFDVETTTDPSQRLLFGSYRYCRWDRRKRLLCVEEGLIYGDDLPERNPEAFAELQRYVERHEADVGSWRRRKLRLLSRREFVDDRFWRALKAGAHIVGFNLPFDLTRLAIEAGEARNPPFYGGFTLTLWGYQDPRTGALEPHQFRPRLCFKLLDSKRAFIGLKLPKKGSSKDRVGRGRFLDLRTLAFALTAEAFSLEAATEAFGVPHPKQAADRHGVVDEEYISYNRGDVRATAELLERLRAEFDRHPIPLLPEHAYSPASIAKGYLAAMGLIPPAERFGKIDRRLLGIAMTAYYGGRAEVRIRKTPAPVVLVDFLSMYPTVNALLGGWSLLTAKEVVIEDATAEVRELLQSVTLEQCLDPAWWRKLAFFALIEPDQDVLPVRAQYGETQEPHTIGVNYVSADGALWYAGPDLVASTLLACKPPTVRRAIRLVPKGMQPKLRRTKLRGTVPVDPRRDDFFRVIIEARTALEQATEGSADERQRLRLALKVLANSGGYGILAELNRQDVPKEKPETVTVYGLGAPFACTTPAPEEQGRYCFQPLAALITASARLMLALLERMVSDAGGTYVFTDTDSMAIVACPTGGLVPCEDGPARLPDGRRAVRALSWSEVDRIVARFAALNPYDRAVVSGSILKIEDENYGPEGSRREVIAYAISAKRYALFTIDRRGELNLVKVSEHGLGYLLNPLIRRHST